MPPRGGFVFVGSSSIRFWDTLAEDMAPLPVIRRGFGGAHMTHVIHNAHRVIIPYAPRAIVVFVGGNDLSSGKSAEAVVDDFKIFLRLMRTELPETDIWLLSMKPSKLRGAQWGEMKQVSATLEAIAASDPRIRFVDTGGSLLARDGSPDDVYVFDGLHLNAEGYRRWTKVLKPQLLEAYGED
jgi:lysophospholipase L1-like esterase